MLMPVKCFTCGQCINPYYRYYLEEVVKRKLHKRKLHERQLHERQLHERQLHEHQLHERQLHERQLHERQLQEPEAGVVYLTRENVQKTEEGVVLDEIGFTKICCRRHFLTHVEIE